MPSAEEILENKLIFLEIQTERARDINKVVGNSSRAHTLGSFHPAKRNLWTEWLLNFNAANKNDKVDKKELKKLLNGYIKLFEKFRLTKCPPFWQDIKGTPCTIVSKSLSKLSDEYDLNYSRVPPLIELAARKVPDEKFEEASREMVLDSRAEEARGSVLPASAPPLGSRRKESNPRAAEDRRGGKKRRTKKRKKSKKVRKKKRKTRKGGAWRRPLIFL